MLLSWRAQIAAHEAYIERHPAATILEERARTPATRRRRHSVAADACRDHLLRALQDGRPHPFADLRAALPDMSAKAVYRLVEKLAGEGLITITQISAKRCAYSLT